VTGGAGFIASHIVNAYLDAGLRVVVLDDLSAGDRRNIDPRATFVEGDIRDIAAIDRALGEGIDVISHHAAQADVRVSVNDPAFDADVNIVGSLRLLQRAVERGVQKIVFASSGGAAYGEPLSSPQTEDHPTRPLSPYGCAKLSLEQYLFFYRAVYGVPFVALRYANVYGPRQRKEGEAGVVAIFAGKLLDRQPVVINGDGQQTRDYVFVGDVVRANVAALRDDVEGAWNVGTGVETSVNDLYAALALHFDSAPAPAHAPAKKGEQMRSVLDGTRLRSLVSLPEPVSLADGLAETIAWIRGR
jgi:UDP-glucose 4-epimerase